MFVEALEEFPNHFTQSETSGLTSIPKAIAAGSKYVMLLSNFGDEHRGLNPVSEMGFRQQVVLVPPRRGGEWAMLVHNCPVENTERATYALYTRPKTSCCATCPINFPCEGNIVVRPQMILHHGHVFEECVKCNRSWFTAR